jgi:hypothetical protein
MRQNVNLHDWNVNINDRLKYLISKMYNRGRHIIIILIIINKGPFSMISHHYIFTCEIQILKIFSSLQLTVKIFFPSKQYFIKII